ncbi:putative NmrA-like family domain-containing protein 1 [Halenospora varia]|nr:putative NmrA-like family domain-containing protein 1 [Halenospora varia]
MSNRKILVTGATGKQGGAVIDALRAQNANFQILALTRNASSSRAQALARESNVTVVEGDVTKPVPIFEAHKPIYGVFSVTTLDKKHSEESQAYGLIDESIKNGVEHFVFTSVDRGGPGVSEKNPTIIPHFLAKHNIEVYMKEQLVAKNSNMQWTILRPVGFMDNLTNDFMGKGFTSMWAGVGSKPLQLISCHDIGVFAAKAFLNPATYNGRAISLAGDELNIEQARETFKDVVGSNLPETFGFVGSAIKWSSHELSTMFNWFKSDGYGADIPALKKEEPKLQTLGMWLKESSQFKKQ